MIADAIRGVSATTFAETSGATYEVTEWSTRLPDGELAYFGDSEHSETQARHYAEQMGGKVLTRTTTVTVPSWSYADEKG